MILLSGALAQSMNESPTNSGITVQIVSLPFSFNQFIAAEEKIDLLINECYQRLLAQPNNIEIAGLKEPTETQSKDQVKANLEIQLRCRVSVVESSMGIVNFGFWGCCDL